MNGSLRRTLRNLGGVAAFGLAAWGTKRAAVALARAGTSRLASSLVDRLLKDYYDENLWEAAHVMSRLSVQTVVETSLRAEHGTIISRPLGSRRHYSELDKLLFDFAQLSRIPRPQSLPVDTSVVIGPRAKRPMQIEIPVMVSAMAYGLALTRDAKLALARGAAMAGTSANSGQGVPAPGEMEAGGKYVLQISRSSWNRNIAAIQKADMLEILIGQGSTGATGHRVPMQGAAPASLRKLGISSQRPAHIYTQLPQVGRPGDLGHVVNILREYTDAPIGAKMGAGKFLEEDLQMLLEAGVDVITLDGGQAGTHAAAPTLEDDHGLPTFYALCRASAYLAGQGVKGDVSLVVSGGRYTPGDFLKCLGLGADAIAIGSTALIAISHPFVTSLLPWEPPTQLVYAAGNSTGKFDVDKAARSLCRYLMACSEEMALSARALGKAALRDIDRTDMVSIDPHVAEVAGVDTAHQPQPPGTAARLQPEWLRKEHELAHRSSVSR